MNSLTITPTRSRFSILVITASVILLCTLIGASTATADPGPTTDLTVTNTVTPAFPGEIATYTIRVANKGPSDATDVAVNENYFDFAGTAVEFVGASSTQGGCQTPGFGQNSFICSLGTIVTGQSATVTVQLRVKRDAAGRTITNTASAHPSNSELNSEDNSASASFVVATAPPAQIDLATSQSSAPAFVKAYGELTYTIPITNRGATRIRDVIVSHHFQGRVGHLFSGLSNGYACGTRPSGTICMIAELAPGQTVIATLKVVPFDAGPLAHTVSVEGQGTDINPADNTNTLTVNVAPGQPVAPPNFTPVLSVRQQFIPSVLRRARTARAILTVRVAGRGVDRLRTCNTLPRGLKYRTAKGARINTQQRRACWTRPSAELGRYRYRFTVKVARNARRRLINKVGVSAKGVPAKVFRKKLRTRR
jgi:uncharacterized repeat protein (TIGR01451 family)